MDSGMFATDSRPTVGVTVVEMQYFTVQQLYKW